MAFYDLNKDLLHERLRSGFERGDDGYLQECFADEDTYIRKAGYTETGKLYFAHESLRMYIVRALLRNELHPDFKVRQTVINAAGEIGKWDFEAVTSFNWLFRLQILNGTP